MGVIWTATGGSQGVRGRAHAHQARDDHRQRKSCPGIARAKARRGSRGRAATSTCGRSGRRWGQPRRTWARSCTSRSRRSSATACQTGLAHHHAPATSCRSQGTATFVVFGRPAPDGRNVWDTLSEGLLVAPCSGSAHRTANSAATHCGGDGLPTRTRLMPPAPAIAGACAGGAPLMAAHRGEVD